MIEGKRTEFVDPFSDTYLREIKHVLFASLRDICSIVTFSSSYINNVHTRTRMHT